MKVAIISDDQRLTQKVVQVIDSLEIRLGEVVEKPREAYLKINTNEPRIVVFVEPAEDLAVEQIIRQIKKVNKQSALIFLNKSEDLYKVRGKFRAGIFDLLQVPDELDELEKSLERAQEEIKKKLHMAEQEKVNQQSGTGSVISLYSGKGGTGTSLLGANLAHVMGLNPEKKILFIDLNLQFGVVQSLFNIEHNRNLGDLKPVIRELTGSQLMNVVYRMESGLHVLLSPNSPEEAEQFTTEDIEMLIAASRLHFDVVVLDIPKELNEISITALGQSDYILYVVEAERPAIVNMQSVLDLLERYHLIRDNNVFLIVNKFSKMNDISLQELKRMIRFPILGTIADDYRTIQPYINLGIPWYTDPKLKIKKGPVKDLLDLEGSLQTLMGGV